MNRPIESKFKIYEENLNQHNYFNKLVDERAFFEVFPDVIDYEMLEPTRRDIATYAKGNLIGRDGTLMRVFEKNARIVNTTARTIQWTLYAGEGDIRANLTKVYTQNVAEPGKGHSIFEIGLDVEWFGPNDLLIMEGLREVPLLVKSDPIPDGSVWKYEVVVYSDNPKDYFRNEDLETGSKLLQVGSLIGESTTERGHVYFGEGEVFVQFEVPMNRMGWEMKITDNAQMLSKNYRLEPRKDESGASVMNGLDYDVLYNTLEMKFMAATNRQVDLWLTYGRSAGQFAGRFLDGMTEKPLATGPGLFEFLESSYVYDYPIDAFDIDMFAEFLPTVWDDKVPISERVTDIYTGKGGLIKWQEACKRADIAGVLQTEDLNYNREEGLFPGRKGVAIGAKQYRAVFIEPFGLIRVHHLPFLDSEMVETRRYKNLPITSYQFIIFDYGYGDGRDSNIYIMKNEQVEQYGYITGTWGPLGPMSKMGRASSSFISGNGKENAFYYFHETMFGLVVKDPSAMVWYRPNFI